MTTYSAGYAIVNTYDSSRNRPVVVDLWYPASQSFPESSHSYGLSSGSVAEHAPIREDVHPVILLSHGAFGSSRNYSWIAEHLARCGYLVAGVSHYGESQVYGPETIDPAAVLRPWLRTEDCSFTLSHLLKESPFARYMDASRIGALGHSSGGATAIELGGAVFDPLAMQKYCDADVEGVDRGCWYSRHQGEGRRQVSPVKYAHRDERIKAVVALDPALGPGHDESSLSSVAIPVHVVGAVENDFLPFTHHAERYARLIPGAALTRLSGGEGHFVFLDQCQAEIEAGGVSLCRDRGGVDRGVVHGRLREIIRGFFNRYLK